MPTPDAGPKRGRLRRLARRTAVTVVVLAVALTGVSFGYNLATDGPAPRPRGLRMISAGGFDTRYRTWGTSGSPVVLVPGAFETADTFAAPPKRVIAGVHDPQLSAAAAAQAAARIGAPRPAAVPGWHLTMISSPRQVAAAISTLAGSIPR